MKFESVFFKGKKHYESGHRIRAKLYSVFCRIYFHCDIPLKTKISENVYFCHNGFGCVINPNAVIGDEGGTTTIQHSVTIGELNTHDAPIIGNNVFIGAGAMVLGNITVSVNAKIGAGAVVLTDVPEGCTAVGVPARIVNRCEDTET